VSHHRFAHWSAARSNAHEHVVADEIDGVTSSRAPSPVDLGISLVAGGGHTVTTRVPRRPLLEPEIVSAEDLSSPMLALPRRTHYAAPPTHVHQRVRAFVAGAAVAIAAAAFGAIVLASGTAPAVAPFAPAAEAPAPPRTHLDDALDNEPALEPLGHASHPLPTARHKSHHNAAPPPGFVRVFTDAGFGARP
jgi:hypothetical protein